MAGKSQTSAAHQTMKFVYSEAVNRALRQRCRGLQAAAAVDDGPPPLPPELLLAVVVQSGDVDLSAVLGRSAAAGRPPNDADATAAPDAALDYEISNLAEIYREISRAVDQVRRRSTAATDASTVRTGTPSDRPATRAAVAAASKTPTKSDEKGKTPAAVGLPPPPTTTTHRSTAGKDTDRRHKDERKVHFNE